MTGRRRMSNASVLVYLAEEVLTIDELQWSSRDTSKMQASLAKRLLLGVSSEPDQIGWVESGWIWKTLPKSAPCSRPGNHERRLRKSEYARVVEVDRELERQERTDSWNREEQVI
jgi:hypothetical protein